MVDVLVALERKLDGCEEEGAAAMADVERRAVGREL